MEKNIISQKILLIAINTSDKMPGKKLKVLRKIYAAKLSDEKPIGPTCSSWIIQISYRVPAEQPILYELSTL